MVTALFFLWAMPNNLNDVLIRQFMKSFQISRLQAGLIQSAFYFGYFCVSMPAAFVLRRFGYRIGLVSGLMLYSFGCFLFWPAAEINRYSFFLLALFVIAAGLAFLETGAASFVTQLGEPETSERRLNFAQSFNPPGTIAGALIGRPVSSTPDLFPTAPTFFPIVRTAGSSWRLRQVAPRKRHLDRSRAVPSRDAVERPPHFVRIPTVADQSENQPLPQSRAAFARVNSSISCQHHQSADHSKKRQQEKDKHIDVHHLTPLRPNSRSPRSRSARLPDSAADHIVLRYS
ncbi:MFS transporter [Tunturiibacter gelidoferens]|uniref:MFS transporter n=1 Tax=Tunturiibacter gelidiferens TaxID=3069689 RepID=A0AAU7Z2U9_9BACT